MSSSGRGRGRARSASPPASGEASSGDESGANWQRVVAEKFELAGGVWRCRYKRRLRRFDKKGQLSWQTMPGTAPSKEAIVAMWNLYSPRLELAVTDGVGGRSRSPSPVYLADQAPRGISSSSSPRDAPTSSSAASRLPPLHNGPSMRMRDRSNSPEPVTFLAPFATDDPCSSDAAAAGAAVAASLDDATPALHGAVAHSASQLSDGSTFVGYINAIPRGRPPLSLEEASDRAHELQTGSRRRKKRKPHAPSRRDLAVTHDPVTILTQRRWGSSSSARAARKRKDERAAASAVYAEEVGSCRRQHFWWLQLSQSS